MSVLIWWRLRLRLFDSWMVIGWMGVDDCGCYGRISTWRCSHSFGMSWTDSRGAINPPRRAIGLMRNHIHLFEIPGQSLTEGPEKEMRVVVQDVG